MNMGLSAAASGGLTRFARSSAAKGLLDELRALHAEMLEALDHKEQVTGAAAPVPTHCALVRWNVARARHRRRKLIHQIHARVLEDASAEEAATLRWLEADELKLCQRSADHLQSWTMERIAADWPCYSKASAAFVALLRQRITIEMQTLYPMLGARL